MCVYVRVSASVSRQIYIYCIGGVPLRASLACACPVPAVRLPCSSVNVRGAHSESVYVRGAHRKGVYVRGAHSEGVYVRGAHSEGVNVPGAHSEGAYVSGGT